MGAKDFDGGLVGESVSRALVSAQGDSRITWTVQSPERFGGLEENLMKSVAHEDIWVAVASAYPLLSTFDVHELRLTDSSIITVHSGVTTRLNEALITPNAAYDGSKSITAYAVEARNENAL